MNIKLEHTSIIDQKISSFARAVMEIFHFFLYRDSWVALYLGTKPTNISLAIVDTVIYQTTVDQNLNKLKIVDGFGQHTPIKPITLTGRARDVTYIPREATHFCWIYPPVGLTQLSKKQRARLEQEIADDDLEYTFLALGGFAYFCFQQNSYEMLQANCLVQEENILTFHGSFQ
jgi:hypothetical protein